MGMFYFLNWRTDQTYTASAVRRFMVPAFAPQWSSTGTTVNLTQAYSVNANSSTTINFAISTYGFCQNATSTGTFTVTIQVWAGNSAIQGSVILKRMAEDGVTVLATSAASAEQAMTVNMKTFTLTNPALGTWGATDRLAVDLVLRNTNTMSSQSLSIRTSLDVPSGVDVPWSTTVPELSRTVIYSNNFETSLDISDPFDGVYENVRASPGLNGSGWRCYNAGTVEQGTRLDNIRTGLSITSDQLCWSARVKFDNLNAFDSIDNFLYLVYYREATTTNTIARLGVRVNDSASAADWVLQTYGDSGSFSEQNTATSFILQGTEHYIQYRISRSRRYSEVFVDGVLRVIGYHTESGMGVRTNPIDRIRAPGYISGTGRTVARPISVDDLEIATAFPPAPASVVGSGSLSFTGSAMGFRNVAGIPVGYTWGVTSNPLSAATFSLTSLSGGYGVTAPAAGDLVVVAVTQASTVDRAIVIDDGTTPYTLIGSELYSNGSVYDANLRVAYKVMGSTPDTSFRIGPTTSANEGVAFAVWVIRNVNPVNPIGSVATATGTGGSLADPPAITPTSTASRVMTATGSAGATISGTYSAADSDWFTWARSDNVSFALTGLNVYFPNTTNPAAITGLTSAAGDSWAAVTFEVRLGRNAEAAGTLTHTGAAVGNVNAGRSGSASGTLDHSTGNTATGRVVVRASGDGDLDHTTGNTATGRVLNRATSTTGTLPLTGAATADNPVRATSTTGTLPLTGTATGDNPVVGTSTTGTLPLTGVGTIQTAAQLVASGTLDHSTGNTATARVLVRATSTTGDLDLTGAADGRLGKRVSAAGSLDLTGSAVADNPVRATSTTGTLPLTGAATLTATFLVVSAGTLPLTGAATATNLVEATASGSIALTGSAVADNPVRATAAGSLDLTGSAVADNPVRATAAGATSYLGDAEGTVTDDAFVVAAGTLDLTGAATGDVAVTASAAGALDLNGAASSQPITYVGGQTVTITPSTATAQTITFSLTGGTDSTPQAGDLVIVSYGVGSTADRVIGVTTAGYVETAELYVSDTYDANLSVSYKFMGETPDTDVTVSATGATVDGGQVVIQVYRNVDPVTPEDVTDTTASAGNGGNVNPAAITPVSSNTLLVVIGATASTGGTTYTASYLSDFVQGSSTAATNDITVGMGWVRGPAANTAYDPAAWTAAGSVNTMSWAAVTLALRTHAREIALGAASGALDLTGAATGTVQTAGTQGVADGFLDHAGASTATVRVAATASGDLTQTGAATGAILNRATASGTLTHTGAATATNLNRAAASGSIDLTGAATSNVLVRGSAAGSLDLTGSATASSALAATASGTLTHTGAATGAILNRATASGTLTHTGAATIVTTIAGAASGTLTHTGAATATNLVRASAAGALDLTGASTSTVLVRGVAAGTLALTGTSASSQNTTGSAAGTLDLTGAADGRLGKRIAAAGTLDLTGAAVGRNPVVASAAGALDLTGAAVAANPIYGSLSGSITHTGAATGAILNRAAASGTLDLTGAATATNATRASAAGTLPLTGTASATVRVAATAAATLTYTGAATGAALVRATASGALDLTGAAAGINRAGASLDALLDLTGSATSTVLVQAAASGTLVITGQASTSQDTAAVAAGTLDLTGTATGQLERLGAASGLLDLTGAATAELARIGAAAGSIDLTGSATARVLVAAQVSGATSYAGASTGTVSQGLRYGTASSTYAVTQTLTGTVLNRGAASGTLPLSGVSSPVRYAEGSGTLALNGWANNVAVPYAYVGGMSVGAVPDTAASTVVTFNLTGGVDTVPRLGDLVVVWYGVGTGGENLDMSLSSAGYTEVVERYQSDYSTANFAMYYKFMGEVPDTQVLLGPTGNAGYGGGAVIHVFRGIDPFTPLDVTTAFTSAPNSGLANPPALTTASKDTILLFAGATADYLGVWYNTPSYAEGFRWNYTPSSWNITVGAGFRRGPGAGQTYDPAAFSFAAGSERTTSSWIAFTAALRLATQYAAGTASGTLPLTGSATAEAARKFSAAGTLDLTGAAVAKNPVGATATHALDLQITTTGAVLNRATAAGDLPLVGVSPNSDFLFATAAGSIGFSGSAAGLLEKRLTAAGSIDLTGTASAQARAGAAGDGVLPLTGAATARIGVGAAGDGLLSFTGASVGNVVWNARAVANGNITHTGGNTRGLVVARMSEFVDSFDDPNTVNRWDFYPDAYWVGDNGYIQNEIVDGALRLSIKIDHETGYDGSLWVETKQAYLLDAPLVMRIRWPDFSLYGSGHYFEFYADQVTSFSGTDKQFYIGAGGYYGTDVYYAIWQSGTGNTGVYIPLSQHLTYQYVRIRQDATNGYIDASPDGVNWTNIVTKALTGTIIFYPSFSIVADYPLINPAPFGIDLMAINVIEPPIGQAEGFYVFTGAAEGTAPALAQFEAYGALTLDGTATGAVLGVGQAAGSLALEGYAAAQAEARAQATGVIDFAGNAAAISRIAGAATPTTDLTGSATGRVANRATAAGSLDLTGAATATVVADADLIAAGSLDLTGAATARVALLGEAVSSLDLTGASEGAVAVVGAASGALDLTGAADTDVPTLVAANGGISFTGTATAQVEVRASLSRSLTLTGLAAGLVNATLSTGRWAYEVGAGPRSQNITDVLGSGENAVSVDAETNRAVLQGAGENVVSMIQKANSVQIVEAANSVTVTKATNSVG